MLRSRQQKLSRSALLLCFWLLERSVSTIYISNALSTFTPLHIYTDGSKKGPIKRLELQTYMFAFHVRETVKNTGKQDYV